MNEQTGQKIASKLMVIFNGIQKDFPVKNNWYVFTDPQTGSSFIARGFREAKIKLVNSRARFCIKKENVCRAK